MYFHIQTWNFQLYCIPKFPHASPGCTLNKTYGKFIKFSENKVNVITNECHVDTISFQQHFLVLSVCFIMFYFQSWTLFNEGYTFFEANTTTILFTQFLQLNFLI